MPSTTNTQVNATDISRLISGQFNNFVGEFIDYLDGIPSKNICPNERILKPEYVKILKTRQSTIIDAGIAGFERKKTLGYFINSLMSPLQFSNMAGFNLVNLFGDFKICYKGTQEQIKIYWHRDMMRVLAGTLGQTPLPGSRKPRKIFIATSEDYEMDKLPNTFAQYYKDRKVDVERVLKEAGYGQDGIQELLATYNRFLEKEKNKNTNPNEFNTYQVGNDGNIVTLEKQALNVNMYHNYYVEGHTVILNIHNASSLTGTDAIKEIHELLELFNSLYAGYRIILCGDSNVYYSDDENGMKNITQMGNMLRENGYNLLISRYTPTKRRPRNFFQNSQSAEKGFEENHEETMFIAYPTHLQALVSYDHDRYFIVGPDETLNMDKMVRQRIWAFEGAHLGYNKDIKEGWEGINICNYHEYLFSDHMPIYLDIEGMRIITANNASVKGKRGLNNNRNNFQDNVTSCDLEKISNEVLAEYFMNTIMRIINSLIRTESGTSILSHEVINKYNSILFSGEEDAWKMLKKLCQLKLC